VNAATVCRSGVCGGDDKCGYREGEGSCTDANAATVCRTGICSALFDMCATAAGCAVDADCTSAQFCDTSSGACTAKLANGIALPTISGHDPVLDGQCTTAAGAAVCASGVCDPVDDKCGYPNGSGTCTTANAATVCRSEACGGDGKCGYPDGEGTCTSINAGAVCRSGMCSSESHVCITSGGCAIDADCTSVQFCNTSTHACTPKLANGAPVPEIAGHDPALTGACSAAVGAAVCESGVCDESDDECGHPNGEGTCTQVNAGALCRSNRCGRDGKCGLADGEGICTAMNAAEVCRSGVCDADEGLCGEPAGCAEDADCSNGQFCNTETAACVNKLDNGQPIPEITGHTPALNGACSAAVGTAVCKSGVCDERDDRCGYANDGGACDSASASRVCRSTVCGSDGQCGFPDGEGECDEQNASRVCREGMCTDGTCGEEPEPEPGCRADTDCNGNQYCQLDSGECKKRKADGKPCDADNHCQSDSCHPDHKTCNTCIGDHCGQVKISGGGCRAGGTTGTSGHDYGLIALAALALALRARRRIRV
jgi:MYXO-CTERM domain-containing protein